MQAVKQSRNGDTVPFGASLARNNNGEEASGRLSTLVSQELVFGVRVRVWPGAGVNDLNEFTSLSEQPARSSNAASLPLKKPQSNSDQRGDKKKTAWDWTKSRELPRPSMTSAWVLGSGALVLLLASLELTHPAQSVSEQVLPLKAYSFSARPAPFPTKAYHHRLPGLLERSSEHHKEKKFAKLKKRLKKKKDKERKKLEKKRKKHAGQSDKGWDEPEVSCWEWGLEVHDSYSGGTKKEQKGRKKKIKKLRKQCKKGWKKKEKRRFKAYKKKLKKGGTRHPCGDHGCYHGYEDGWNGWNWWKPEHNTFNHGHYDWYRKKGWQPQKHSDWDWK